MQPGLTVTSVPLNIDVPPSPRGTLAPAVSYKLIKLDQSESKAGSDPTPKFVLAGQDANDPLLPTSQSKHLKNRKVCHVCCVLLHCNDAPALALFALCEQCAMIWTASNHFELEEQEGQLGRVCSCQMHTHHVADFHMLTCRSGQG